MNSGRCFLRYTEANVRHFSPVLIIQFNLIQKNGKNFLELWVIGLLGFRKCTVCFEGLFSLYTHMDQESSIPTIINEHIRSICFSPFQSLGCAPPILLQGFSFPSEHRYPSLRHGGSCMILCTKDVARAPTDLSSQ